MKIGELYRSGETVLSLEVFPPQADYPLDSLLNILEHLVDLQPSFISVTYGAGGANRGRTVEIAARIRRDYGVESLAHLTCVGHCRADIDTILTEMAAHGIDNILALRGDPPTDQPDFDFYDGDYHHAIDLIREVREKGDFGVAGAAYPEGHVDCLSLSEDLRFLREKVDAGLDLLITQIYFDNRVFYDFLERCERIGITIPVAAGIMPVLQARQIRRMLYMSGASIPAKLLKIIDRYEHDPVGMEAAGIDYASRQIEELLERKVDGIHLYSMNKWRQSQEILRNAGMR